MGQAIINFTIKLKNFIKCCLQNRLTFFYCCDIVIFRSKFADKQIKDKEYFKNYQYKNFTEIKQTERNSAFFYASLTQ